MVDSPLKPTKMDAGGQNHGIFFLKKKDFFFYRMPVFLHFFHGTEKFSVIRAMCNPLAVEDQVHTNIPGTSSA